MHSPDTFVTPFQNVFAWFWWYFCQQFTFKMWLFSYNSLHSGSLDSPYLPLLFPDVSNTHFTKSTIWIEKEKSKWPTEQHKVCHPLRGARAFLGIRSYTGSNGEAAIILLQVLLYQTLHIQLKICPRTCKNTTGKANAIAQFTQKKCSTDT